MVNSNRSAVMTKDPAKTPAVELKRQITLLPSHKSIEDEVMYLRSQNKILKNALNAVKDTATEKLSKSYELVWYARNRTRYPSHKASMWLDHSKEHSRDIENLHSPDGDFHHGFNSGVLAATRMFKAHADVVHLESDDDLIASPHEVATKHKQKIDKSKQCFPDASADTFPPIRSESN
mmetsp:Transcript_25311/g.53467  ORF Transcript_25311/g.53467 Transcript_25311/m.53467 type:complete len:178 (+) Transcript_25311:68-601(+)